MSFPLIIFRPRFWTQLNIAYKMGELNNFWLKICFKYEAFLAPFYKMSICDLPGFDRMFTPIASKKGCVFLDRGVASQLSF